MSLTGRLTLVLLFFAWGAVGVLVRMTVPHFKAAFDLSYREALMVQLAFFLTYLLFSRASGRVTAEIGFRNAAALGLALMGLGSLCLALTTLAESFWVMLPSFFLIACGVTYLQVAANPLAAVEGKLRTASGNLTFAQGFNSLGTVAAPLLAGIAFLGAPAGSLAPVRTLFLAIAVVLLVLAGAARRTLHEAASAISTYPQEPTRAFGSWEGRRLRAAVLAIFFYVGAEVAITTTLVNLLEGETGNAVSRASGAGLTSIFWIGMVVGRFASTAVLERISRKTVLATAAIVSAVLCCFAATLGGLAGAAAVLAVGLFAGLQFPTIFAIASADLAPDDRAHAAGWLCTGIVGGGVVPVLYGAIADRYSLETALFVPAACFCFIAWFAYRYGDDQLAARGVPASAFSHPQS